MKVQNCPDCSSSPYVTNSKWVRCCNYNCFLNHILVCPVEKWNAIRFSSTVENLPRYDLKGQPQTDENATFTEFRDWMNPKF